MGIFAIFQRFSNFLHFSQKLGQTFRKIWKYAFKGSSGGEGYLQSNEYMKNLLERSIETSIFENLHEFWERF